MKHVAFDQVDIAAATTVLNRIYEGYLIPMVLSRAQTELHLSTNDVDRHASPLWLDGEQGVAAALLGVRGERGWIGGFGLVPELRGRGLARALLDEVLVAARERGLRSLQLEALVDNLPAIRTYERGGFEATRRLVSYQIDAPGIVDGPSAPPAEAAALIAAPPVDEPSWQCERLSLERQTTQLQAVAAERAHAVFRHNGVIAQVVRIVVGDRNDLARLARGIFEHSGVKTIVVFNQPEGGTADRAAREAELQPAYAQFEMRRAL